MRRSSAPDAPPLGELSAKLTEGERGRNAAGPLRRLSLRFKHHLPQGGRIYIAAVAAVLCIAAASDPAERLPDPAQEARARELFREVRCLVCQNESIDDSNAELAGDLRRLVREEIKAGKTNDQVRDHLTDRYGEFVLLKPAFSWGNAALWGAPVVVVILGLLLLLRSFRSRPADEELTPEEAKRLDRLSDDRPE